MQLFFYLPSSQVLAEMASLLCRFFAVFLSKSLTVLLSKKQSEQAGVAASSEWHEVNDEVILS